MYRRKISYTLSKRINEPRRMIQVIAGPRQVGKTFAVKQALDDYNGSFTYRLAEGLVSSPTIWLENEWNAARLAAKAKGEHLLIIDEIQKIHGWSDILKRLWDEDSFQNTNLKAVILGSSRLLLQKGLIPKRPAPTMAVAHLQRIFQPGEISCMRYIALMAS